MVKLKTGDTNRVCIPNRLANLIMEWYLPLRNRYLHEAGVTDSPSSREGQLLPLLVRRVQLIDGQAVPLPVQLRNFQQAHPKEYGWVQSLRHYRKEIGTAADQVGADHRLLHAHTQATFDRYYSRDIENRYMDSWSKTSQQLQQEGWNAGRSEVLRTNLQQQETDLQGYYQEDASAVRKSRTLNAKSTGRNRAALKRALLTAMFNLTVPKVTANLLTREKYPHYRPEEKRGETQSTLMGHLKTFVFLDKAVSPEARFAFETEESLRSFWNNARNKRIVIFALKNLLKVRHGFNQSHNLPKKILSKTLNNF